MERVLIDTDIIVDFFRGYNSTKRFFGNILKKNVQAFVSVITIAEIYAGIRGGEQEQIESFFLKYKEIPIYGTISKLAGLLKNRYGKSHGLMLPDALIAATAIENRLTLYTNNIKHFKFIEVSVRKP